MAVGEIFLSAFITLLFEKLLSPDLMKLARREGLQTAIKKLEKTLREIQALLNDAEKKQIADKAIKLWLEEHRDLAYDSDDILDEVATEALRHTLIIAKPQSKVRLRRLPSCFRTPSALAFHWRIGSKIKEINNQLEDIATQKTKLGLVEKYLVGESSKKAWQRPPTTSLVIEPFIHGRNKDREEIIELLLKAEAPPTENTFGVIPIVGMGGIGKTTLAQHVANDDRVKNHFNLKAWVCVSDDYFDVTRITKAILESFTLKSWDLKELNALQVRLNEILTGKKFLLVLDDVWNMRFDEWNVLRSPFRVGAHGSKIIVTTRNSDVASKIGPAKYHRLENLSNDDCWLIFAQHAFENTKIKEHPNLELIGKKIVEKCSGLPLAAMTLGTLLRCKQRDEEWENVLNSKIWNLSYKENEILPALKLSYHHLPSHLKRCFDYCAVIPKDYVFKEKEIVLMWMAEGLIHGSEGNQQTEDLGCEYFRELVSISFFQPSSTDNSEFIMHDLINDLAQVVAGKMCSRLDNKVDGGSQNKIAQKARHLSYTSSYYDGIKRFEVLKEVECLRTFLPFTSSDYFPERYITSYVLFDLLPKLKCLRVLCLSKYRIIELPDSIGDLKHLRYLNLSYTCIRKLPESVANLCNLQVMLLKGCQNLEELPLNMGNMINLHHLDITHALHLEEMPLQMGKLTNLQTLSNFIVGKGSGSSSVRELRNLQHLQGTISISRLENVIDSGHAREVNLKYKQGIKELFLQWGNGSRKVGIETDVLEFLQPHLRLEQLTIKGYTSTRFPTWLGDGSFSRMVLLGLEDCRNCKSLPPLGQLPLLKELWIIGMSGVEKLGPEFYGEGCSKPFPSLENLTFMNMEEWKDWLSFGVDHKEVQPFTRLTKLHIRCCVKLQGKLPKFLPSLKELVIEECSQLVVALPSLEMLPVSETRNSALDLSSLTYLSISDVPVPVSFCNLDVADEVVLRNATSTDHLKSLTRLHVKNIPNFTSLPLWFFQGLTGLEEVKIMRCRDLASLWQNGMRLQQYLPALRHLAIESCPQLFCLFEEKDEEQEGQHHEELPCLRMLEYLEIRGCEKLVKLPRDLHTLTFLGDLMISDCPSLVSFPKTGLPSKLKTLTISDCSALESLTEGLMHNNSIEVLDVSECPSLTCLSSRGALPPTLKGLCIFECEKLESIVDEGLQINSSLNSVTIAYCGNLKSLPDGPHNLSELLIAWCGNLESLPEGWLSSTSLRKLRISDCEKLEALPNRAHLASLQWLWLGGFPSSISYFLQGNFPNNLNSLFIINDTIKISKLPYPSEWGLHRLSCLRVLHIWGSCRDLVSFPEGGMSLPTPLTELWIMDFPNLKYLSSEFQNLLFLEDLTIRNCPKLTSLPDQGLPGSLLQLWIDECPLLQQRCKRERGQYWPMIAHIPHVEIDGRFIFDPEVD